MQDNKVTSTQGMDPEVWLILGASWVTENAILYIAFVLKNIFKKVRKHRQRHVDSISPQVNTEKAHITSGPAQVSRGNTVF